MRIRWRRPLTLERGNQSQTRIFEERALDEEVVDFLCDLHQYPIASARRAAKPSTNIQDLLLKGLKETMF